MVNLPAAAGEKEKKVLSEIRQTAVGRDWGKQPLTVVTEASRKLACDQIASPLREKHANSESLKFWKRVLGIDLFHLPQVNNKEARVSR